MSACERCGAAGDLPGFLMALASTTEETKKLATTQARMKARMLVCGSKVVSKIVEGGVRRKWTEEGGEKAKAETNVFAMEELYENLRRRTQ